MSDASPSSLAQQALPDYERLQTYFQHKVGCQQEANDLTQETFFRLVDWRPKSEVSSLRGLLFRIANNLLIDRSRRKSRQPVEPLTEACLEGTESPLKRPDQQVVAGEDLRRVQRVIAELPAKCREVFVLNRFGGLSYPEIAVRLEIAPSTVEKHMMRALTACRATLEEPTDS